MDKLSKSLVFVGIVLLGPWGCASEPNLTDLRKQVETITLHQQTSQEQAQKILDRLENMESQLDEHDFLVGELIKTEEEASLDTRHLLDKLERTSTLLREQIEQTRSSTERRNQDLFIRVKSFESRLDNMMHQAKAEASKVVTSSPPSTPAQDPQKGPSKPQKKPKAATTFETKNEATAFRSAYKVFLNGQYQRASVEFQRFVKHYPSTTLTPQAFYYLGESFYVQKQYNPAEKALQQVVTSFPKNKYRILSLYKLGHIMMETDQRPKAQEFWNRVIQDYPDSPEATQAKEQLKKAGLS